MTILEGIEKSLKKWKDVREDILYFAANTDIPSPDFITKYWNTCGYCEVFKCDGEGSERCPLKQRDMYGTSKCSYACKILAEATDRNFALALELADNLLRQMGQDASKYGIEVATVAEVDSIRREE